MSAIKDGRYPVELGGKTYHLLFSLNVLDDMQDKFGGFDKLPELMRGKDSIKNIKWILARIINEGADEGEPETTEKQVGKMVHAGNLAEVTNAIFAAFNLGASGSPEPDVDDDGGTDNEADEGDAEEKNAQSARG